MNENQSLTDLIANISPVVVVAVIFGFTLVRLFLAKVKDDWAKTTCEICDTVNFVLVLAFLIIRPFAGQAFFIPSESMEQTLLKGDRLIVEKVGFRFHEPHHGDILVFEAPARATNDNKEGVDFIKRCIGIPGDTIEVKGSAILIDNEDNGGAHPYLRDRLNLGPDRPLKIFKDYVLLDGKEKIELAELARRIGRAGSKLTLSPGQTIRNGEVLNEPYTNEDPDYTMEPKKIGPGELFMMGDNRNHSQDSHIWGTLERRRVVGRAVVVYWPPARIGSIR